MEPAGLLIVHGVAPHASLGNLVAKGLWARWSQIAQKS
jgi:hypothetical protein